MGDFIQKRLSGGKNGKKTGIKIVFFYSAGGVRGVAFLWLAKYLVA